MNTPETDKAERMAYSQEYMVPTEFARKLERERDEANEELHKQLVQIDHLFDEAEKIRIERDEAMEKIKRQTDRIRYLEGATNHACGTPLSVALRERDEARNKMADALQEVDLRTLDFERMKQERDIAEDERIDMAQQLESEKECHARCQNERDEALSQIVQAECRAERFCQERDEAREALMEIEDLFIDGTDIYTDRENMGLIAKAALEETK